MRDLFIAVMIWPIIIMKLNTSVFFDLFCSVFFVIQLCLRCQTFKLPASVCIVFGFESRLCIGTYEVSFFIKNKFFCNLFLVGELLKWVICSACFDMKSSILSGSDYPISKTTKYLSRVVFFALLDILGVLMFILMTMNVCMIESLHVDMKLYSRHSSIVVL